MSQTQCQKFIGQQFEEQFDCEVLQEQFSMTVETEDPEFIMGIKQNPQFELINERENIYTVKYAWD